MKYLMCGNRMLHFSFTSMFFLHYSWKFIWRKQIFEGNLKTSVRNDELCYTFQKLKDIDFIYSEFNYEKLHY